MSCPQERLALGKSELARYGAEVPHLRQLSRFCPLKADSQQSKTEQTLERVLPNVANGPQAGIQSTPHRLRRQAHQDRIDIAAGLEAEQSPPVIDQIELGIAPAPFELLLFVARGERRVHAAAD